MTKTGQSGQHEKLAIDGGNPAFSGMAGKPEPKVGVSEFLMIAERFGFSDEAMGRLRETLSDADLGGGPHLGRYYGSASPSMGDRFEALAREKFGVKHAYAVCNGTCALQAALMAVGVGPGTEIIVPATGFIATGMAGAFFGATPIYCDVDASLQMDPDKLEALITPRTAAVLPTHHWGFVSAMDPIVDSARRHNIAVIEDCAQSPGATYHGRPVGSLGDIGCFSISSYKIIGGGEGGMIVTNDDRLFDRIRQAAEAGGLWRPDRFAKPRYDGELFAGSNYRMSELESAIDVIQMQKLDGIVSRHRHIWKRIRERLSNFQEITWQSSNDPDGDIGYLMRFFPRDHALGDKIVEALQAEGIGARCRGPEAGPDWHLYRYHFPLFDTAKEHCRPECCPVAADLYERCISISLNQWWSDADCDAVAGGINKVLNAYCTRLKA
ncbi:MAG: DegT/DnrJ/EryC1/StrS family aminotransferase [Candidatus Pacebacteria bacterium]|nr:DegT/DnrJ/EryC1/StrS family aminotransferase [Candidatus Paceibacterota bacterium]